MRIIATEAQYYKRWDQTRLLHFLQNLVGSMGLKNHFMISDTSSKLKNERTWKDGQLLMLSKTRLLCREENWIMKDFESCLGVDP